MLLTLIAIVLFTTFGQAFDSQHNNKDILRYDSRGNQHAKEMLHSDQRQLLHKFSEIINKQQLRFRVILCPNPKWPPCFFYEHLSVPIEVPTSSFSYFHVPMNATSTATGLRIHDDTHQTSLNDNNHSCLRNDCNNNCKNDPSPHNNKMCNYERAKISAWQMQSNSSSTQDDEPKHSSSHKYDG